MGAAYTLSWDYLPGIPQGEAAEFRVPWKEKPIGSYIYRHLGFLNMSASQERVGLEMNTNHEGPNTRHENTLIEPSSAEVEVVPRPPKAHPITKSSSYHAAQGSKDEIVPVPTTSFNRSRHPRLKRLLIRIYAVLTPVTASLLLSLPVALVPQLKALFVDISDVGGPDWKSPDGRPPLGFLLDTGMS